MRPYSSKAEKYARYRWDYAEEAIEITFKLASITPRTVIADMGAGTGILTKHFVDKAQKVFAIEPEPEMRAFLEKAFSGNPNCQIIKSSAEHSTLHDHSIDLVTVGQAIHWFEADTAREEFLRILKPSGWLAILRNYGNDASYQAEVEPLFARFSKASIARRIAHSPTPFYFGNEKYQKLLFPFAFSLNWQSFLGSMMSSASMPDEEDPNFAEFVLAARCSFDVLSHDGWLRSIGETELFIGCVTP